MAEATIGKEQKQQLAGIGLVMIGEVRLITDAKVVGHNEMVVTGWPTRGPRFKMYTSPFNNIFAPSPNLVINLH